MRDLAVRQVYSHEVRAQDPGRDRLMMSGQNGSRQIIEAILRPFENPKNQSDGDGRLNPSRFLFRLALLSWPLAPVRRIALFFYKIPEFSGFYMDRVYPDHRRP